MRLREAWRAMDQEPRSPCGCQPARHHFFRSRPLGSPVCAEAVRRRTRADPARTSHRSRLRRAPARGPRGGLPAVPCGVLLLARGHARPEHHETTSQSPHLVATPVRRTGSDRWPPDAGETHGHTARRPSRDGAVHNRQRSWGIAEYAGRHRRGPRDAEHKDAAGAVCHSGSARNAVVRPCSSGRRARVASPAPTSEAHRPTMLRRSIRAL